MMIGRLTQWTAILVIGLEISARALVNDQISAGPTVSQDQPYSAIWQRNVFDLKPPASTEVVVAKTNAPPPNIKLTGIHNMFGKLQALFIVQKKATPGVPAKDDYVVLSAGQRQDTLEVLEIDAKANAVKIKNEEVVSTITFETNSASSSAPGSVTPNNPQRPNIPPTSPFFNRQMRNGMNPPGFTGNNGPGFNPQNNGNQNGGYSPYGYSGGGGIVGGGYPGSTTAPGVATGNGAASTPNVGGGSVNNGVQIGGGGNGFNAVNAGQNLSGSYSGVTQQNNSGTGSSLPLSTGVAIPTDENGNTATPTLPSLPAVPAIPTDPVPALGVRYTGTAGR